MRVKSRHTHRQTSSTARPSDATIYCFASTGHLDDFKGKITEY